MCNKAVEADPCLLKFVPARFRTHCLKVVEKRKAQKAQIKKELMRVVFLKTRRKRQKNFGHKHETFLCLVTGYKKYKKSDLP